MLSMQQRCIINWICWHLSIAITAYEQWRSEFSCITYIVYYVLISDFVAGASFSQSLFFCCTMTWNIHMRDTEYMVS